VVSFVSHDGGTLGAQKGTTVTAWMVRGGRVGERESWAIEFKVSGGGFREVGDLTKCSSREEVLDVVKAALPGKPLAANRNFAAQLWALRGRIQVGDIVVMPLKASKQIAIGRCTSGYKYLNNEDTDKRHAIGVDWVRTDIPRSEIKQDLLFSLGAFMTVCQLDRNDAEMRLKKILEGGSDPGAEIPTVGSTTQSESDDGEIENIELVEIETVALDAIRIRVIETFQSHQLSELTAAILQARGLTCVVSPPGPDKGIDIVAGAGPLGLDSPRIVVQCKSGHAPVDVSVIQRLQGAMSTIGADQALLVAFGGVNKPAAELLTNQQFKVKVWDADTVVEELLKEYPRLDPEIQELIPLRTIWTLANPDA
jgi:restriction system protein